MWPLGHVAIAYLLYVGSTRVRRAGTATAGTTFAVCVGALFPDLVDKPLAWQFGVLPTGRSLAHSLLVLVPLCLLVAIAARRLDRGECGLAFAVGALSHPLADALPAVWSDGASVSFLLWPYLPVEPYESGPPSPIEMLSVALSQPYFLIEPLLLAAALLLWRAENYPGLSLVHQFLLERIGRAG